MCAGTPVAVFTLVSGPTDTTSTTLTLPKARLKDRNIFTGPAMRSRRTLESPPHTETLTLHLHAERLFLKERRGLADQLLHPKGRGATERTAGEAETQRWGDPARGTRNHSRETSLRGA